MGNKCCRKRESDGPRFRTVLPSTADAESVQSGNSSYANNSIRTTKYNIFTFIPLNLYEQLHRFANVYFIFIVILNFIPQIGAFGKEVAPIPVVFVLLVTMVKDGYEDCQRWLSDRRINRSNCKVHSVEEKRFVDQEWQHLQPGDFIRLTSGSVIPADVLLLHSSDKAGIAYVETANLDGETSLKLREVVKGYIKETFDPFEFVHPVEIEVPNKEIYKFAGTIHCEEEIGLRKENIVLRGCVLRNTDYVIGMVIYAGKETKAMLNNKGPRFKRSKLERQINKDIIWCVVMLLILCFTGSIGSGVWLQSFPSKNVIYLTQEMNTTSTSPEDSPAFVAFLNFWTFIIIYQAMIPLPLYVSIELVKIGQVYYLSQDIGLYDEETNKPIEVKAFNITEDLGQIQYIFADKTGTLTDNKMEFKRCTINGIDYEDDPNIELPPTLVPIDDRTNISHSPLKMAKAHSHLKSGKRSK